MAQPSLNLTLYNLLLCRKIGEMKTIATLLTETPNHLNFLTKKAALEQRLAGLFSAVVDPKLAKFCRFAHYEHNRLTLLVANSAWLTKIRFQTPELIKTLRQQPEFATLNNIYCVIDENIYSASAHKPPKNQRSPENEAAWRALKAHLKQS